MVTRLNFRIAVLFAIAGAMSGIAYAAVRPVMYGAGPVTAQLSAAAQKSRSTPSIAQVQDAFQKVVKSKKGERELSQIALKALTAQQNQAKVAAEIAKEIQTAGLQQTLANVVAGQGFVQKGPPFQSQVQSQLQSAAATSVLTQTLGLGSFLKATASAADSNQLGGLPPSAYAQGQGAKIITGQATSSNDNAQTVLAIPGLLHVSALWSPSDGIAQFSVVNDSGGTLDFGGDLRGIPYEDQMTSNTPFGSLAGLSAADGTIAPGGAASFQITPRPASTCDTPSQEVPYRAEAHVQVTAPGAALATLDLSAYVIDPTCAAGSALLSGMAVVAPA